MAETKGAARYAVFEDRGKQYRAEEGALVRIDLREAEAGTEITFDRVLLVGGPESKVGRPTVPGASVVGTVECEEKGPKVHGLKRRHHASSATHWGHRQRYTLVKIDRIMDAAGKE